MTSKRLKSTVHIQTPRNCHTKRARNIVEKIWDAHVVAQSPGHPAIFGIDLMLIHEVTSAQAFEELERRGLTVCDPRRLLATVDHSIPTHDDRSKMLDEAARMQVETLRNNCKKHDIRLLDFGSGQGIVHVVGPELGLTQPGMTIVCGDSHTSTHGAFGALAFGIGTSEVLHVLATGCLLQEKPRSMKVEFRGYPRPGVLAKDIALKLISEIGISGGTGHVIEYVGESVRNMTMEERMTVCNLSIECGARAGLIAPDETTFLYLKGRPHASGTANFSDAVEHWKGMASDQDCFYDKEVIIDLSELRPMVTWGTNPGQVAQVNETVPTEVVAWEANIARALAYTRLQPGAKLEGIKIDWAFVGSCTNGRIEDLRIAAQVLNGNRVCQDVTFYVVPGSEKVRQQAIAEGLDKVFTDAGAEFRMPGCSLCLAMNGDQVPPAKRCISSSNRNFVGRQGPGSITHLASPATVAASAIAGTITSPESYFIEKDS